MLFDTEYLKSLGAQKQRGRAECGPPHLFSDQRHLLETSSGCVRGKGVRMEK